MGDSVLSGKYLCGGVFFFFFRGGGHGVFFSLSVLDFVFFLSPFLHIMSSTMKKDI